MTYNKVNAEDDEMLAKGYSYQCGRAQHGSCSQTDCACGCHAEVRRIVALEAELATLRTALAEAEQANKAHVEYAVAVQARISQANRERDRQWDDAQVAREQMIAAKAARDDALAKNAVLVKVLEALAKVQYDGTVEGLRHQIEKEDWGDVLAIDETRAAYELTLEALALANQPVKETT